MTLRAWGGGGSLLLLLAAGLLAAPAVPANLGPGDTFYVGGCYVEVLGCYLDPEGPPGCFNAEPPAGCPPDASRALPYNLPGCFPGDPNDKSILKAPSPPPCDPSVESNAYCAQQCISWAPRIPDIASSSASFYAATQAGYACFCGAEKHAEKYVVSKNKLDYSKCDAPCGTNGGARSPAGKAGEMCGGGWHNTTMRVSCGLQWGAQLLLALALGGAAYVGGGVFGPFARGSREGLGGKELLTVHPHYLRWVELGGLVQDGITYAKARRSGRPMPPRSRAEPRDEGRGGRGGSSKRSKGRKGSDEGGERGERGGSDAEGQREDRGSKKEKKAKRRGKEAELAAPLVAAAAPAPAPAAGGTAAGDGGRWVHVPN